MVLERLETESELAHLYKFRCSDQTIRELRQGSFLEIKDLGSGKKP